MNTKMFTIGKVRRDIRDGLLSSYTRQELLELAAWLREKITERSESAESTNELVRDLVRALSQHVDPKLNPLNEDIRGRDVVLVTRGMEWLGRHSDLIKCIKCESQATQIVNGFPYCESHAGVQAHWLLEHEGVVSRFCNKLGFVRTPNGEYIPVKENKRG